MRGFDKIAGSDFGWPEAARRAVGRMSTDNPSLSATLTNASGFLKNALGYLIDSDTG